MEKLCQCSMPLTLDGKDVRGTESDGSSSLKYCLCCYRDGQFINPDTTFDEMLTREKKLLLKEKETSL